MRYGRLKRVPRRSLIPGKIRTIRCRVEKRNRPKTLLMRARRASRFAYAPYSKFPVGAAVLDSRGLVFVGSNVENISFGLTMCAERVAIFSAIAAGAKSIEAVAISARMELSAKPCGACRQVMAEFCAPDAVILLDDGTSTPVHMTMTELLPHAFAGKILRKRAARTKK